LFNTTGQNERIIVPNGGTTMNYSCGGIFHISDHWLCGNTEDMFRYFDINNPLWNGTKSYNFTELPIHPVVATEVEFCRLWMLTNGINYSCVSEFLKDKFIVLDNPGLQYDQVKNPTDNIMNVRTDWVAWCDPLSMHHNIWLRFYQGKTFTLEQELELNKHKRWIF
jgi:hypothetical protein